MERETPNYYAVIPADVRYDSELRPNEKLLYGEITALSDKHGYCWATNRYFAELYEVTVKCVSKWINHLIEKGYLFSKIIYEEDGKTVAQRIICVRPIKQKSDSPIHQKEDTPIHQKEDTPIHQKEDTLSIKSSNRIIQDISIQEVNEKENIIKEKTETEKDSVPESSARSKKVKEKFIKPTIEEIRAYCYERKNMVDPEHFYDHYESNGWKIGKNGMKDWKAAVRTWERNDYGSGTGKRGSDPWDVRNQFWDENDPTVH